MPLFIVLIEFLLFLLVEVLLLLLLVFKLFSLLLHRNLSLLFLVLLSFVLELVGQPRSKHFLLDLMMENLRLEVFSKL